MFKDKEEAKRPEKELKMNLWRVRCVRKLPKGQGSESSRGRSNGRRRKRKRAEELWWNNGHGNSG